MDMLAEQSKIQMQKVLDLLKTDLATIRTGRAAPSLVENIIVSAYGNTTKLRVMELATVAAQDTQTLVITPFDGSIIGDIRKGIEDANIGLTPVIDTPVIRISIPALSEERRQELIHLMKQKLENGKIMIRQARHEAMDEVKKNKDFSEDEVARLEKEIQRVTDESIALVEQLGQAKEKELMQI